MKAIELKMKYGARAFYEAVKFAFNDGCNSFKSASNLAEWLLYEV